MAYRQTDRMTEGRFIEGFDGPLPVERDVETVARLLVSQGSAAALEYLHKLRIDGVSDDRLYSHVLDPVARRLDEQWNGAGDAFTDMALTADRLHRVLHDLDRALMTAPHLRGLDRRVLVAAAPGEEITCASLMVAAFFHRAGWDVVEAPTVESYDDLMGMIRDDWVAVVHLGVTRSCRVAGLARGIECLRRASENQSLGIILGGMVVREEPAIAARVGADAAASSGPEAVDRAEEVLGATLGPC